MKPHYRPASLHARPWLLSARTCLFALALTQCAREPEHPPWQCNDDFVCDPDENQKVCPSDCVWKEETGEGPAAAVCDAQENWTFVQACLGTCGNGEEDDGETLETCPRDFPGPGCGDGVCAPLEDPARCPTECHAGSCGDGKCEPHENAAVCAEDCTSGCGDGVCQSGEEASCGRDCVPCTGDSCICGDGVCGEKESMMGCPADCTMPNCGNGVLEDGEACDDGNKSKATLAKHPRSTAPSLPGPIRCLAGVARSPPEPDRVRFAVAMTPVGAFLATRRQRVARACRGRVAKRSQSVMRIHGLVLASPYRPASRAYFKPKSVLHPSLPPPRPRNAADSTNSGW